MTPALVARGPARNAGSGPTHLAALPRQAAPAVALSRLSRVAQALPAEVQVSNVL